MYPRLILTLFSLLFAINTSLAIPILTGNRTGTYAQIAFDLQKRCRDLRLELVETKGSTQNVEVMRKSKQLKFGFIQADLLQHLPVSEIKKMNQEVKMVYPLYLEEIHLIANKQLNIHDVRDLEGLRVNIGAKESGSAVTAENIKDILKLNWRELNQDPKQALAGILRGEIDAMLFVVGSPWKKFDYLPKESTMFFELIPIDDYKLRRKYVDTKVYFHNQTIDTLGVYSFIATNSVQDSVKVRQLIQCIKKNKNHFLQHGHPKWRKISIDNFSDINWALHPELNRELKINQIRKELLEKILE